MKNLVRLPAFYLCLLLFAVVLVFFEDRQEHPVDWRRPSSGFFRLPKIQSTISFNESTTVHTSDGTSVIHASVPTHTPPMTLRETTAVTQRREGTKKIENKPPLKTILVWTFGYGDKSMGFGEGQAPFKTAGCEVDTCSLTGNRTLIPLTDYDAIIFHFRALTSDDLPAKRSPNQRWIFWEAESASYVYQDPAIYNGLFNWTMTYRLDSDVEQRYGRVYPVVSSSSSSSSLTLPSGGQGRNYAKGKTKLAAWFVSNCFTISRREKIVRFMKKLMQVDVYGKCGQFTCPREITEECYQMVGQHYKFYLSFENSLCKDYVTEKLFSVLRHNVVPIVFGMANYTKIAPPNSFINVMDFPTVNSLVKYLKYLDANDTAYNEYFKWKRHYTVDDGWTNKAQNFCDLCKKLHQNHTPKVYRDMKEWFVGQGGCIKLKLQTSGYAI